LNYLSTGFQEKQTKSANDSPSSSSKAITPLQHDIQTNEELQYSPQQMADGQCSSTMATCLKNQKYREPPHRIGNSHPVLLEERFPYRPQTLNTSDDTSVHVPPSQPPANPQLNNTPLHCPTKAKRALKMFTHDGAKDPIPTILPPLALINTAPPPCELPKPHTTFHQ